MTEKKIRLSVPKHPSIPARRNSDPTQQRADDAIKETLETMRGTRGDPLDRAVFIRDLVATGLLSYSGGAVGAGPAVDFDPDKPSTNVGAPPLLKNIIATAGFSFVSISWDDPQLTNVAYYEIWRKRVDNPFEDNSYRSYDARITAAEKTELAALNLMTERTPAQTRLHAALSDLEYRSHIYWVAHFAANKDPSLEPERVAAAIPLDAARVATQAAYADDALTATHVGNSIGVIYSDPVDKGRTYIYWVRAVSTAGIMGPFNANGVSVTTQPDILAIMQQLTDEINNSLIAEFIFNGIDMTGYAGFGDSVTLGDALVQQQAWIDDLNAGWGVRIEYTQEGKPYVVGFGLNVDATDPNDPESTFLVRADRFAVLDPDDAEIAPFIVDDGKVYIHTALINKASILELIAGSVVADFIRVNGGLVSPIINTPQINIGTWTRPKKNDPTTWVYNPTTGRQGNFSVDASGVLHARYAYLRGAIIADVDGNIILDTTGGPYSNSIVTSQNPIDASNIGTFISHLAVGSLHIAGNAVTVPASGQFAGSHPLAASFNELVVATFSIEKTGLDAVDNNIPVLISWSVEASSQNSNASPRQFRIRHYGGGNGRETIYTSFEGGRDADQYSSGAVQTTINAGDDISWALDGKGSGTVYQATISVTGIRR